MPVEHFGTSNSQISQVLWFRLKMLSVMSSFTNLFFFLLSFLCKWENVLIIIHTRVLHCKVWINHRVISFSFFTWHYWVHSLLLFEDYNIFMFLFTQFNLWKKNQIDCAWYVRTLRFKNVISKPFLSTKNWKTNYDLGNNMNRKEIAARCRYFLYNSAI